MKNGYSNSRFIKYLGYEQFYPLPECLSKRTAIKLEESSDGATMLSLVDTSIACLIGRPWL